MENRIKLKALISAFIMLSMLMVGCTDKKEVDSENSNGTLTKQNIMDIANKAAMSCELYIDGMKAYYDVGNKKWEKSLSEALEEDPDEAIPIKEHLENRCYQAVLYEPNQAMFDGTFWIFIDKKTGEVILFAVGI